MPLGVMERFLKLAALTGKSPALVIRLVELSWNVQRLGTLVDVDDHAL